MGIVKLFENWVDSIEEGQMPMPYPKDEWDSNWSDSVEDDLESAEDMDDEEYPDDEWDSNWSDS